MTDHIKTRNEMIYQEYVALIQTMKCKDAIEKLSDYIWEVGGKAECLSCDAIKKIVIDMKKAKQ